MLLYPKHTFKIRLEEERKRRKKQEEMGMISYQLSTHSFPRNNSNEVACRPDLYPNLRYIVIIRNGKEVTRSFYDFMNSHTPELKKMWGGFPPTMQTPMDMLKFIAVDIPDFYFNFVYSWYQVRHLPNVLLLHYTNLRNSPKTVIEEIANFLQIQLSENLLQQVLQKSSLEYMSARHDLYFVKGGEPGGPQFKLVDEGKHIIANGGRLDKGGTFFTPEMDNIWNKAIKKYFRNNTELEEFAEYGKI